MDTTLTRFIVSPDVRSRTDNDGTTILHIAKDKIYSIIGVGSMIWAKLVASREGLTPFDIVKELSCEFTDVPHPQIESDAEQVLKSLQRKKLIEARRPGERRRELPFDLVGTSFLSLTQSLTALLLRIKLRVLAAFLGLA